MSKDALGWVDWRNTTPEEALGYSRKVKRELMLSGSRCNLHTVEFDRERLAITDTSKLVLRTILSLTHDEAIELGVIIAEFIEHSTKGNK